MVLTYRSGRLVKKLAEQSDERFRVVDEKSAYYRVRPADEAAPKLYRALVSLLGGYGLPPTSPRCALPGASAPRRRSSRAGRQPHRRFTSACRSSK